MKFFLINFIDRWRIYWYINEKTNWMCEVCADFRNFSNFHYITEEWYRYINHKPRTESVEFLQITEKFQKFHLQRG